MSGWTWTMPLVLNAIRNPHGYSEELVRQARLIAADEIERLEREVAALRAGGARVERSPISYVFDRDTNYPTKVTFANGRTVEVVGTGYLVVGRVDEQSNVDEHPKMDERHVLDRLVSWLDAKGSASVVCQWGDSRGATIRKLIEQFRDEQPKEQLQEPKP